MARRENSETLADPRCEYINIPLLIIRPTVTPHCGFLMSGRRGAWAASGPSAGQPEYRSDFQAESGFRRIPVRQEVRLLRLHRKVFGLRVVDDDGGGRLLGVELVFFGEGDADFLGVEQR